MALAFVRTFGFEIVVAAVTLCVQPVSAETLFHRAENQVPVAIVQIERPAGRTRNSPASPSGTDESLFRCERSQQSIFAGRRSQLSLPRRRQRDGLSRTSRLRSRRCYGAPFRTSGRGLQHVFLCVWPGRRKPADRRRLPEYALLEFSSRQVELSSRPASANSKHRNAGLDPV